MLLYLVQIISEVRVSFSTELNEKGSLLNKAIIAQPVYKFSDFQKHQEKTSLYQKLIRKFPVWVDPLVMLRDKQKSKLSVLFTKKSTNKSGDIWRGKSLSIIRDSSQPTENSLNNNNSITTNKLNLSVNLTNNSK